MALKEFSLEGKTALITGGGRGIGRAIALVYAEAGCDVAVVARTRSQVEEVAGEIQRLGRRAVPLVGDVSDYRQVDRFIAEAVGALGKVDVLVNNAGVWGGRAPVVPLPEATSDMALYNTTSPQSPDVWESIISTNLFGPYYCCRAVGKHMIERRQGKVINILSNWAIRAVPLTSAYSASKAALRMFTRVLALEWAPFNVNVNAIGPGIFPTEMTLHTIGSNPKLREKSLSKIPLNRFTDVRDLGLLALYLASPASDWMTGQCIYLDGGEAAMVD